MKQYLVAVNFNKNPLRAVVLDPLSSAPGSPVAGMSYFDTILGRMQYYENNAWGNTSDNALNLSGQNAAYYLDRANQTGTQLSSTISNFNSAVQANRIDQLTAPTANVDFNSQRIVNLANPTDAQDAATMGWVQSQVSSAAAGIDSKPSVRVVTNANITLSGTQTIDDVAVVVGDRVLVRAQSTASQNGAYVVASGAWTRATDGDVNGELTPGAFWFVEEGTAYGKTQWRIENTGTITVGTTSITINQFGAATSYTAGNGVDISGSTLSVKTAVSSGILVDSSGVKIDTSIVARKYAATIGNGTNTSFTIAHNLGTKDIVPALRLLSTDEIVEADVVATDINTATVTFAAVPSANSIRVVILG